MRRFLGFVKKEFFHILRDTRTLVILIFMPIIQIILFGYAITNEIKDAPIAILDESRDYLSDKLIQKMLSSGYFILYEQLDDESEIDKVFQKGKVKQVVVLPPDFAGSLGRGESTTVQVISDASDPNTGNTLLNYTSSIIRNFQLELNQGVDFPSLIQTEIRLRYNPEMKSVFLFVPGLITIILMLVCTMMTSISITREKELGTMEVLMASPMHPAQVILAKVIPYLLLSFFNAVMIIALGYLVFNVPVVGSLLLLLLECLLFIIAALSLGILISTRTSSQQVALMVSLMGMMLPTILLSGFIFPIENMPGILQIISNIIPAKWFIIIAKGIMLKGVGLDILWKETLILGGFTLGFIALSIKNYNIRLA